VAATNNFLCGYNTSKYQLHLLKSVNSFSVEEHKIVTMASEVKLKIDKDLFVFHDHHLIALYFIANEKEFRAMQIISAISDTSFLKIFGID